MNNESTETTAPKRKLGFALMSREQVSAISRLGGKAAHRDGKAHKWSSEEAQAAGRKGGQATRTKRAAKVETP